MDKRSATGWTSVFRGGYLKTESKLESEYDLRIGVSCCKESEISLIRVERMKTHPITSQKPILSPPL